MKKFFLCLTVGWMCFVFYQGSREIGESYHNSDIIVNQVMELLEFFKKKSVSPERNQGIISTEQKKENEAPKVKEKFQKDVSYIIRKSAHFFEYGLLAALLAIDFYFFNQSRLNLVVYSLFITLLCAVGDEFYQSFIGRGSNVRDIVIDFSGALFGIACVKLGLRLVSPLKSKSMKAD